ncbi:hypothetical protein [Streptomyces europaeiscabiei]|uniref:hypothetical protein n=1 Tax=Streptomyces europaeiscabiei TaxID=146819 RepID=UPI0029C095E9|nr:hypothetical protein [Streptomyces europaeiscabiei]
MATSDVAARGRAGARRPGVWVGEKRGADMADVAHDWGISSLLKDAPVHDASPEDGSSTGDSLPDASAKDTD